MTTTLNNKHKKLNVPNLRFPEFQGEWSVTSLQKDCIVNPTNEKIADKFVYVDLESVKQGQLYKYQILTKDNAPSRAQRVLHTDDILFQCVRPYQMNNYMVKETMSDIQWVASTGYAQIRTQTDYPAFLYYVLNTSKYNKAVMVRCTGSSYPAINSEDLSKIPFYKCGIAEQKKIADFLSLLDARIATQHKLLDKLQSLIKGICNNYFEKLSVQEKANLIRLSDVLKERNEYSSKDGKYIHGTLSKDGIFPKTGRWDRDFLVKQEDKKYKVTHLDDICYNPANLKFGVICRNTFGDLIFSPIYVTFEVCKNVNIGFMELYLTNHNFIEKVRRFEQGTVYERMAVSPEDFLSYKIRIPSYSDQTFFYKKVQWLITLSQNEMKLLSQYKKLRQYLLRQMFI